MGPIVFSAHRRSLGLVAACIAAEEGGEGYHRAVCSWESPHSGCHGGNAQLVPLEQSCGIILCSGAVAAASLRASLVPCVWLWDR